MRIINVDENGIKFDNGNFLHYDFLYTGCSFNYADWKQIEDLALDTDFDEASFTLESCAYGFRFGNPPIKMFFIPCYSEQNGYYDYSIDVMFRDYHGKLLASLGVECKDAL